MYFSLADRPLSETALGGGLWRRLEFGVAPGPGAGRGAGHGGGRGGVLGLLQFVLQLLADAGLQGRGREPLLGEATL